MQNKHVTKIFFWYPIEQLATSNEPGRGEVMARRCRSGVENAQLGEHTRSSMATRVRVTEHEHVVERNIRDKTRGLTTDMRKKTEEATTGQGETNIPVRKSLRRSLKSS